MKLAEIMQLALRQLDEDPADISEYDDLFRRYANEGYQIAMRDIIRPRQTMALAADEDGHADIQGMGILRIVQLQEENGRDVWHAMAPDGTHILTGAKNKTLNAVVETDIPLLIEDMDVPEMPEWAHSALADYICYRHLSAGNAAKQQRAQFFYGMFSQTIRRIRPQSAGSVTGYKNLYTVTDARYVR